MNVDRFIFDLLIILAAGLVAGLVSRRLRFPVVVGYLLAGVSLGPGVLGIAGHGSAEIEYLAEAGVFLLLFSVGLEFSLADLARLGWRLPIGGSLQMLLVALPVAGWLTAAGLGIRAAILVGLAVSFSSTVLVFQSLAEWGKSGTPHGRRAIGILLFQDAALIPILLLIPMITGDADSAPGLGAYFRLGLTSVAFVAGVIVLRELLPRWVMPLLLIDRSVAPAVLFTCVVLGGMTFAAYRAGLPPVVGAFAAGLILSGNRWTAQVDALALPFRETFATVFFVSLGLLLDPAVLWREWRTVGAAVVAVLALKAVAGIIALRGTGLAWRSSLGMGFWARTGG